MTETRLQTTADGSKTLYSERYGQSYHSHRGALSEAKHVFLEASGVAARLRAGQPTRVLEVGFGTGLNFLVTADLALRADASLHYCALERSLLSLADLSSLGYRDVLSQEELFDAFLEGLPKEPPAGRYRLSLYPTVTLELLLGEATAQTLDGRFDAVYHDAFSPDSNPELWSEGFLRGLYASMASHAVLSSYCVKGTVRRRLQELGFAVRKRPGPAGGKREMMVAAIEAGVLE